MPTYNYRCENDHELEIFCSATNHKRVVPCNQCELQATQILKYAPDVWIAGVNRTTVLDYPGSKQFKAGYQHLYGGKARGKGDHPMAEFAKENFKFDPPGKKSPMDPG